MQDQMRPNKVPDTAVWALAPTAAVAADNFGRLEHWTLMCGIRPGETEHRVFQMTAAQFARYGGVQMRRMFACADDYVPLTGCASSDRLRQPCKVSSRSLSETTAASTCSV